MKLRLHLLCSVLLTAVIFDQLVLDCDCTNVPEKTLDGDADHIMQFAHTRMQFMRSLGQPIDERGTAKTPEDNKKTPPTFLERQRELARSYHRYVLRKRMRESQQSLRDKIRI